MPGPGEHARQEDMAACMWRGGWRGEGQRVRRGGCGGQVNEMSDEEESKPRGKGGREGWRSVKL